jgi:hypothetical protein
MLDIDQEGTMAPDNFEWKKRLFYFFKQTGSKMILVRFQVKTCVTIICFAIIDVVEKLGDDFINTGQNQFRSLVGLKIFHTKASFKKLDLAL